MRFRPFLWLTIVSLPTLLVLVGLGSWQLQRLQWKNDLIASFESRAAAPPIAVPAADASLDDFGLDDVEFRRLALVGTFQHDKEVFLTGRTYEGNAGFHIVTPFQLDDGRIILINRGWVSEDYRDPAKRAFSQVTGPVTVAGILRRPGVKGYFVPENEPDNDPGPGDVIRVGDPYPEDPEAFSLSRLSLARGGQGGEVRLPPRAEEHLELLLPVHVLRHVQKPSLRGDGRVAQARGDVVRAASAAAAASLDALAVQ